MNRDKLTRTSLLIGFLFILMGMGAGAVAEEVPFTLEDRDRLIKIEVKLEEVDKRLEFMQDLMIGMLVVFGGLCGIFVGLLLWDRKTFKEKAKEEAIKAVEEGKLKETLASLREYANVEPKLKDAFEEV